LDENFEKFTFEVLIGGGEGIEKNITRLIDKRMPDNRLAQVGGIVA